MRRLVTLAVASIIIIGLLLALFVIKNSKEIKPVVDKETEQKEKKVIPIDESDITGIGIKKGGEYLKISRDKGNPKKWLHNYPYDIAINQEKMNNYHRYVAAIISIRTISEKLENLKQYGLKQPQATIRVNSKTNTTYVLSVGSKAPSGEGYYILDSNKNVIHLCPYNIINAVNVTIDDFRERKLPFVDMNNLSYMKLNGRERTTIEIDIRKGSDMNNNLKDLPYLIQPYKTPREANIENILRILKKETIWPLSIVEFIDDNPTNSTMYGLSNPNYTLALKDAAGNFLNVVFGDQKDDVLYAKSAESKGVFTVDDSIMNILDMKAIEALDRFIVLLSIDTVDSIKINMHDEVYLAEIERDNGNAYYINEKEVDEELFHNIYQNVMGILIDAELDTEINRKKPDITINIIRNTGKDIIVEFQRIDRNYYAVIQPKKAIEFMVHKYQFNRLIKMLKIAVNEETEDQL